MNPSRALVRFLWSGVIFLAFLGVAVATRRAVVLLRPALAAAGAARNPAAQLDTHFAAERVLTLAHVIPAMLFMILGPLQFVKRLRAIYPRIHRWSGRVFLLSSGVVGFSGLRMALGKTIGGLDEKVAILLFGTFFLLALAKALWHAMHRQFAQHREWMIRGFGVGLAIAAIRPIMAAFFAAALIQRHTPQPQNFFGTAFWIGFIVEVIAAELWINYTRPSTGAELPIPAAR